MVKTVLGEIAPEHLGMTYMHEHICADLSGQRQDPDSMLTDTALTAKELTAAVSAGVKTYVDVSCIGMGRDAKKLQDISRALGIHIICATGYYLPAYYPDDVHAQTSEYLAKIMVDEINEGIGGTGVKAGIIGEIATAKSDFGELPQKIFKAAALAHKETGAAITTHCSAGTCALEQAKYLLAEGVPADKIILGHMDLCGDLSYIKEVLKTGVTIGFDTIGKTAYQPDEVRAGNLAALCGEGHQNQIVLSEDISRKSYYKSLGGHGYGYLMTDFLPIAKAEGISDEAIHAMLVGNPGRLLNIQKSEDQTRLQILLAGGAITQRDVDLCNAYIEELSQSHPIDKNHDNFDKFETHLVFCVKRLREHTPLTEFPDHLKEEVEGAWFCDLAVTSFQNFCKKNDLLFAEAEAKYLSVHLAVML